MCPSGGNQGRRERGEEEDRAAVAARPNGKQEQRIIGIPQVLSNSHSRGSAFVEWMDEREGHAAGDWDWDTRWGSISLSMRDGTSHPDREFRRKDRRHHNTIQPSVFGSIGSFSSEWNRQRPLLIIQVDERRRGSQSTHPRQQKQ
jgi:hypothetical protein